MTENRSSRMNLLGSMKPQPVVATYENLVKTVPASEGSPLTYVPSMPDVNLIGWAKAAGRTIERQLLTSGAALFRGFQVPDASTFQLFTKALTEDLLEYSERAAPRTSVGKGVYTSTEFPADQYIPMHHEMSYSHQWPRKIWFFCEIPAARGGCTPISDDREVFSEIPDRTKDLFLEKKVMYVRNFGYGIDLTWQEAFQTQEKEDVERYCEQNGIEFEWRPNDCLRTRQVRQVTAVHPETRETVWFNHAHLFHWSSLDDATRTALFAQFTEDEFPRNALFGDGTAIPPETLDEVRSIYERKSTRFEWKAGDILMLDNILMSHGRDPFEGNRRILVAMADMYSARAAGV